MAAKKWWICIAGLILIASLSGCAGNATLRQEEGPSQPEVSVGVVPLERRAMAKQLTLSSELVPFQEIDVYAKESGYVKELLVDYGTRVHQGQLMAVLEIPELVLQVQQDDAAIRNASDQVVRAQHDLKRMEAQHQVAHLAYDRLNKVANSKPGLVAQQEVDDAQGKDLAAEAQVEAGQATVQAVQNELAGAQVKKAHDAVLFDYSKIAAPFSGVITQRYANLGTLMQAGTSSSTQAMPLVRLSEDDRFRLVIPVPESYVKYIKIGDPVSVQVPSLDKSFPGKVARFSVDVNLNTRTMHTEVDVPNPTRVLIPGMYAEATLILDRKANALAVPLQAVNHSGDRTTVLIVGLDNRIQERDVQVGMQTASYAEVLSGLQDGEQVIVSDRSSLKPGQLVRARKDELLEYHESGQS